MIKLLYWKTSHYFLAPLTSVLITASFNPTLPWAVEGKMQLWCRMAPALAPPAAWLLPVSQPIPRKSNELSIFVPNRYLGSTEICFGLSAFPPFYSSVSLLPMGKNARFLTRGGISFSDIFIERPVTLKWFGMDTRLSVGLGVRSSKNPGGKEPWQVLLLD